MARSIHTIEFPLRFSQEELSCLRCLLRKNPRARVADASMALKGVTKKALASKLDQHPTRILQYFTASDLPGDVLQSLVEIGVPQIVLPPAREPKS